MSLEPQKVSKEISGEGLGSLRGCLVDGDAEQRKRRRSIRRRSLAISVAVQSAILTALILVSLFGKPQTIALANVTPIPPYSSYRHASPDSGRQRPRPTGQQNACRFCAPPNIPPTIVMHDSNTSGSQMDPPDGIIEGIPGGPIGLIPISDGRGQPAPPTSTERRVTPRVVRITTIDPAMLIHRVEPVYPLLARHIRREGHVELHARIATDGSIQALQVVGGDPMFYQSALEAVTQWHYRATILNGQPVEIDTSITVIYTMPH